MGLDNNSNGGVQLVSFVVGLDSNWCRLLWVLKASGVVVVGLDSNNKGGWEIESSNW